MALMNSVYQAFLNIGWSPSQAKIMTAEVGRENDFNPKFVFGRHTDASNGKVNLGMISWQGSRGAALDKRLKSKGLIKNGRIVQSQAALNEMALFMEHEIKTNPAYAVTKKAFLNNPNVSYDVGKKVLGNNFIRWDYSGKAVLGANVGKHHAKRDGYYRKLGGQGGTNYSPQQGGYQQPQRPPPDPRLSMSAPDLLATLRKDKGKRSDNEIFIELANNNGLAGREINHLLSQGANPQSIAKDLGLNISVAQQPQETQQPDIDLPDIGSGYDDFMANLAPQDAPNEPDIQMPDIGKGYDDFMANLQVDEPPQEQAQQFPELGENYDDFMANLTLDDAEPTQAGDTWQTQNELSKTTSSPNSARAQQPLKSSWELPS